MTKAFRCRCIYMHCITTILDWKSFFFKYDENFLVSLWIICNNVFYSIPLAESFDRSINGTFS